MSVAMTITTVGDGGLKQLDELLTRTSNLQGVNEVMGRAGRNEVVRNFVALDKVGNPMGGTRTHYYGQAAASTSFTADTAGATISIAQVGVRLIFQGGIVRPVVKKLLAIPAMPETHGRHPSEFNNLKMQWGRDKAGNIRPIALVEKQIGMGLVQKAKNMFVYIPVRLGSYKIGKMAGRPIHPTWHSSKGKSEHEWPRVFFWLSLEAHIGAHPDVLPSPAEILAACQDAGLRYLLRHQEPTDENP